MTGRLRRLFAGRPDRLIAAGAAVVIAAAIAIVSPPAQDQQVAVRTEDVTISVPAGPGLAGSVDLDASLYIPAIPGPLPAVIMAHGFGGSKESIARGANFLSTHGFVVLAYSARGFGRSTGQIGLDSLDYEVPDGRALVTWLSLRPEVLQDGPGDPRVGVTGASYGGALSLMLAGTDKRVDAVVPLITWNDLSTALFPNAIDTDPATPGTPAAVSGTGDGVFKKSWAAALLASVISGSVLPGGTTGPGNAISSGATASGGLPGSGVGQPTAGCGRLMPALCAAYSTAAQNGHESAELIALLAKSSPASVIGKITAPTLLLQGERDTLFGLDQADANAAGIAAAGTTVAVGWYDGGHDGGYVDQWTRARLNGWFGYYLSRSGPPPTKTFIYTVDGPASDTGAGQTTARQADAYPGTTGAAPVSNASIALVGDTQTVVNPAGGAPAGISSVPGLSGVDPTLLGKIAGGLPGQTARFRSAPLTSPIVIAGTPRIAVTVSAVPTPADTTDSPATPGTAVLFASMSKISAGGRRTLAGGAVSPIRITGLVLNGAAVTARVDLPPVAFQVEAGSTIEIDVSTTDQAYAGSRSPAVYRISLASNGPARPTTQATGSAPASGAASLVVPEVDGARISADPVSPPMVIGLVALLVFSVLGVTLLGRVPVRRRAASVDASTGESIPLEITGVAKSYPQGVAAVTDVSFRVETGQVVGLLGPNGAGKTTTLRMVLGLIIPTAGEIRVFGELVRPGAPVLARIGSFVEGPGFLPHLSGTENLELFWRATGRPESDAHTREALQIADLGHAINRKVKTYSQGMRQRLAIAQAMLGLPPLLVLDEPTNGLDPPQIRAMRQVLRRYASNDRSVLVSSHLLSEIEHTCSHVVLVHQGRTIAAGTVSDMVAGSGQMNFSVDVTSAAVDVLRALPGIGEVWPDRPSHGGLAAQTAGGVRADLVDIPSAVAVAALVDSGLSVTAAIAHNRLEDVFLQLVGAADTSRTQQQPDPTGPATVLTDGRTSSAASRSRARIDRPARSPDGGRPPARPTTSAPAHDFPAGHTLRVRVELIRQLKRTRTQLALGFMAALPLILLLAFSVGGGSSPSGSTFIGLATSGAPNFTVAALLFSVSFLLIVMVGLFFGDSVAAEASWSTLRYLLAIPVPRLRLLRQKILVAGLLSMAALILLPAVAYIIGLIAYGSAPLTNPAGDRFGTWNSLVRIGVVLGYVMIQLTWVAGLAFLLSVLTDAPLGAVGGAVLAAILSQILDQIDVAQNLRLYLPTHYGPSWSAALGDPIEWDEMVRGAFTGLAYAAVFFTVAILGFRHKDITS